MKNVVGNGDFDLFLDAIDGTLLKHKLEKLYKSKKLSIPQLKNLYNTGSELYSSMQLKEAEMVFLAYTTLSPYDHRGPGALAAIYLEKKNYQKALELLNIVKTYPTANLNEVFLNMANCYYHLNDLENAKVSLILVEQKCLSEFYQCLYQSLYDEIDNNMRY